MENGSKTELAFLAALQRQDLARQQAISTAEPVYIPAHIHEPIHGIHREPEPGKIRNPGTRRIPQPYIFVGGKRVSTGRTKRWSQR